VLFTLNLYQVEIIPHWIAAVISEAPINYCRVILNIGLDKYFTENKLALGEGEKKVSKIDFTRLEHFFLWQYISDILSASELCTFQKNSKNFKLLYFKTARICIQLWQVFSTISCLCNKR